MRIREQIRQKGFFRGLLREGKWALSYLRQDVGKVVGFTVLNMLSVLVMMTGSVAAKYLIDGVVTGSARKILWPAVLIVSAAVLQFALSAVSSRLSIKAAIGTQIRLQSDVYGSVLNGRWEALSDFQNGELINRLTGDVQTVASGAVNWIPGVFTRLVQFAVTLAVICYYDPVMALIALAGAPITLILSRFLLKKLRDYQEKQRAVTGKIISFQEETFRNLKTVKSFGVTGRMEREMAALQDEYRRTMLSHHIFTLMISVLMTVLGMATAYVCFGWSVFRLWNGTILFGTMVLFLQLSNLLYQSFSGLAGMVPQFVSIATSAGRLMRVKDLPAEEPMTESGPVKTPVTVCGEHVAFGYQPDHPVFIDLSFTLKTGEITAVVGPSGIGKSTLFSLLLGLTEPKAGRITVLDGDGRPVPAGQMRSCFSLVPQGNTLFAGTVRENLLLADEHADDRACMEALQLAEAADFVTEMGGLDADLGEQGRRISEGQAQRIAIARALLKDAPVLLLDEATAALDQETQAKIFRNLREKCQNKACLVATHRMTALTYCDRVLTISDGGVTESVPPRADER